MFKIKRKQKLYTCTAIAQFIEAYKEKSPKAIIHTIVEETLGYGTVVVHDPENKLKTAIIQERYINQWSSGHTLRLYNKCPKKYLNLL